MTKGRRKPSFQAVEKAGGFFDSLSPFLATKGNPRLCRGEKIAYGDGRSRQEKVSELG